MQMTCSEPENRPQALFRHLSGGLFITARHIIQLQDIVSKNHFSVLQFVLHNYHGITIQKRQFSILVRGMEKQ